MEKNNKVCVIGSGLGGLSAGIYLARAGYAVDIYEQNSGPGGKATSYEFSGFRFDAGPTLVTMGFVLKEIFQHCNENIEDYFSIIKPDIICNYFWEDGKVIKAYSELSKFAMEIEANTSDSSESVLKYLKYSKKIYDRTAEMFLLNDFRSLKNLMNINALKTLLNIKQIDPFRTMHQANSSFFKDPRTIQIFDRYATYNGSNPYLAPATLNIIQHVEYNLGIILPKNGIFEIVEALYSLAITQGIKFYFNSKVTRIIQDKKKIKKIIFYDESGESEKNYDIVVSNSDITNTKSNLLNCSDFHRMNSNPSSSAVIFYWGINKSVDTLGIHNVLFSSDYKKEFDEIFEKKICPEDPTIYIYISSKYNSKDAPAGKENWYVLINAPYNDSQNWELEKVRLKKRIINKLGKQFDINLEESIIAEKVITPIDIEKNSMSYRGSLYGISSNDRSAAFLRNRNKSGKIKGLYYAGGSVHPGGGIPLVLLSGKIAANLAISENMV